MALYEDERYYSGGEEDTMNRGIYAATRVLIEPSNSGKNTS
jgi:hypothetical protein